MRLTRRGLLVGAAAGGGLLAAYALLPRNYGTPLPAGPGETAFDAWIRIGKDAAVTVAVPALEMGQGIQTLIAQVIAVELGADWRQVAVAPAPLSPAYADAVLAERWAPYWLPFGEKAGDTLARRYAESASLMVTAEGTALAAYEGPARAAAAGVRAMLAQAAAARWGAAWEECEAAGGFIVHEKRRLSFAELAEPALDFDPPDPPVLRPEPPSERPAAFPDGAPPRFPRLDLPAKVDGSFTYAGDVRLPGMVYAALAQGPVGDTVLAKFDRAAANGVTGLIDVIQSERWLAAVATNWFAADKALQAMAPLWKAAGKVADTSAIADRLDSAVRLGHAERLVEVGDADTLVRKPKIALRYDIDAAMHAPIETPSAAARMRDGKLELWIASQAPEAARRAAAEAAGLSVSDVTLYPMAAGGSFDARLDAAIAAQAAAIAVRLDKPVQVMWSRWQDFLGTWPRTPVAAILAAATSESGQLVALKTRIAVPATVREALNRVLHGKDTVEALADSAGATDAMALEGAVPPYRIPDFALDQVPVELPLPTARYRGNSHGYTAFFTECFVDELAVLARREPMSYRIAMLGHDPRLAACLSGAARLALWGGGADASGQGIACHRMDMGGRTGRIAVVATARRDTNGVRVDKLSAYANLGRIVNIDIARQQIEGGMVFGLAMAIGGAAAYSRGVPLNARLGDLGLPLLADCPEIETAFAESDAEPFDPGEIGAVAVAPAIANALFSATGLRFRRLPLLSDGL